VILGIDHLGVATDEPDGVAGFLTALGMHRSDAGIAADYGVACEFWRYPTGDGTAVELVSPTREDSAVSGRLAEDGPGLYHIAFAVDDLRGELDRLRRNRFRLVDREPCAGARPGMRVAFLYLPRPAGLLVELVEYESRSGGWNGRTGMAAAGDPAG
jgi:methylmalonyl-CoA/ethylmalonyl-CoA epimerase